jgi:hypothetical protein
MKSGVAKKQIINFDHYIDELGERMGISEKIEKLKSKL